MVEEGEAEAERREERDAQHRSSMRESRSMPGVSAESARTLASLAGVYSVLLLYIVSEDFTSVSYMSVTGVYSVLLLYIVSEDFSRRCQSPCGDRYVTDM